MSFLSTGKASSFLEVTFPLLCCKAFDTNFVHIHSVGIIICGSLVTVSSGCEVARLRISELFQALVNLSSCLVPSFHGIGQVLSQVD